MSWSSSHILSSWNPPDCLILRQFSAGCVLHCTGMKHQGFGGCLGASSEALQTLFHKWASGTSPLQEFFLVVVESHTLISTPGRVTLLSLGSASIFPVLSAEGMLLPAWHREKDPLSGSFTEQIIRVCFICSDPSSAWGGSLAWAERKT